MHESVLNEAERSRVARTGKFLEAVTIFLGKHRSRYRFGKRSAYRQCVLGWVWLGQLDRGFFLRLRCGGICRMNLTMIVVTGPSTSAYALQDGACCLSVRLSSLIHSDDCGSISIPKLILRAP